MDSHSSRSRIQHVSLDCLFFLGDHCATPHFSFSHEKQEGKGEKKKQMRASICQRFFKFEEVVEPKRVFLACSPDELRRLFPFPFKFHCGWGAGMGLGVIAT